MKFALQLFCFCLMMSLSAVAVYAQTPDDILTESSDPNVDRPLDDIVEKKTVFEKRLLPYDQVREADIFWEKRIWRVIDRKSVV